jgi:hypothetical protein
VGYQTDNADASFGIIRSIVQELLQQIDLKYYRMNPYPHGVVSFGLRFLSLRGQLFGEQAIVLALDDRITFASALL